LGWIAGSSTSRPLIRQSPNDETNPEEDEIQAPEDALEDINAEVLVTNDGTRGSTRSEVLVTNDEARRSTRPRQIPARIQDCETVNDNEVNEDGDLVHFALLASRSRTYQLP
jgi:hypothetical protein